MIWLNPWLLVGLAALAVPLGIHLAMRRRPRQMDFPPLRFVRQSHRSGAGRTRLKHLLLMTLRMAALALVVLIVARPMQSQSTAAALAADAPAAVVICFDNSPSMGYTVGGRSRLQQATEQAQTLLDALPDGSRAAVIDLQSAGLVQHLQSDLTLVRRQVQDVRVEALSRPIGRLITSATALLRESTQARREIYVFTDLQTAATSDLEPDKFADLRDIAVHIVDVSTRDGRNAALGLPRHNAHAAAPGSRVSISVDVLGDERPSSRTVALQREGQVRDRRTIELDTPMARRQVEFVETIDRLGPLQGRLVIDEPDALAADNVRYFTLHASKPPKVLIVGRRNVEPTGRLSSAQLLVQALAPDDFVARGSPPVVADLLEPDKLAAHALQPYEAVFLCDVNQLSAEALEALNTYVRDGGHLVLIGGPQMAAAIADDASSIYRHSRLQQLVGGQFAGTHLWNAGSSFSVRDWNAPALAHFDSGRKGDPAMPVIYRAIDICPRVGTQVIMTVGDNKPALTSAMHGAGRVHVLATGLHESWSNLPAQPYEFIPLMHGLVAAGRLAGSSDMTLGDPIRFNFPRELAGLQAILSGADNQLQAPITRPIPAGTAIAQFPPLTQPGNYYLRVKDQQDRQRLFGFSLNIEPSESVLEFADAESLKEAFAGDGISISRNVNPHQLRISSRQQSRELSTWLVPLLMLVLLAELMLANRFYRN